MHHNAAVGANLRDQVTVPIVYKTKKGLSYDPQNVTTSANMWQYLAAGKGPFRSPGFEGLAFANPTTVPDASDPSSTPARPTVQLSLCCGGGWGSGVGLRYGCPKGVFDQFPEAVTVLVTLLRPQSHGHVTLSGARDPEIDPQYLCDPADVPVLEV